MKNNQRYYNSAPADGRGKSWPFNVAFAPLVFVQLDILKPKDNGRAAPWIYIKSRMYDGGTSHYNVQKLINFCAYVYTL